MDEEIRKKIIVSTDDFGISRKANENILKLIILGKIDRLSVMMDGILEENDIRKILDSRIEIDIHFDLVNKIERDGFLGENPLKRIFHFIFHYFTNKAETDLMRKDWLRQIEKFRKVFKKNPHGINSHQHIHFFPPYFRIAVEMNKNFGINYIRYGTRGFLGKINFVYAVLFILRKKVAGTFKSSGLGSSDYLISADWISDFPSFLEKIPDGRTELIFHPEKDEEFEIIKEYF